MDDSTKTILYLYLDESGDFNFASNSTDYFIITGVAMKRPFNCAKKLLSLKYDCIEDGTPIEKFHACEDMNRVRTAVYDCVEEHCGSYTAYAAKVFKPSLPEYARDAASLYSLAFKWLIDAVFENEIQDDLKKVIVVTDSLPKEAVKKKVEKPLKSYMRRRFQNAGIPYLLLHHKSESDPNLQIADYLCWAVQRNEVKGLDWPLSRVRPMFKSITNVHWQENEESPVSDPS